MKYIPLAFLTVMTLGTCWAGQDSVSETALDKFVSINYDQKTYHSGDVVDFFVTIVNRPTRDDLTIELEGNWAKNPDLAQAVGLTKLTENTFSFSAPLEQGRYIFSVSVSILDLNSDARTRVEDANVSIDVDLASGGGGAIGPVRQAVLRTLRRQLLTQNDDGGWNIYTDNPDSLREAKDHSTQTQFGINAMGLLDAYAAFSQFEAIPAAFKTAQALMKKKLQPFDDADGEIKRRKRLYPEDNEFLFQAGQVIGFDSYSQQAQKSQVAEIEYSAAMYLLKSKDPKDKEVDGLPQAVIDRVKFSDAADALYKRLQLFRSKNLIAYDLGSRIRVALKLGNRPWALELAKILKEHYLTHYDSKAPFALVHLAHVITGLNAFPGFNSTIQSARVRLVALQNSDGSFYRDLNGDKVIDNGGVSDHALIVTALSALGTEQKSLSKLLNYLTSTQFASGRWNDRGFESVQGQSQLISALVPTLDSIHLHDLSESSAVEEWLPSAPPNQPTVFYIVEPFL